MTSSSISNKIGFVGLKKNESVVVFSAKSEGRRTVRFRIGHFGKYHNTLVWPPQILHKDCFYFLLGPL